MLAQVLLGRTSKQVARALHISDLTVRKHRENLMRKLGVKSTQQLLALASPTGAEDTVMTVPIEYDTGGIHAAQKKPEHPSQRLTRGAKREST